jgi:hypothetical protein
MMTRAAAIAKLLPLQKADKQYSEACFETLLQGMMINDNNTNMRGKRHSSEDKRSSFCLKNDAGQYEKEIFLDRINEIKFAIKEFEKLYEKAPVTDHLFRAKILREIERSKRSLSKIQVEYEIFKKYKARTAISK